ncbi:MAG: nickel-responsive transcriptional regulator NikR [Ramlibacter sp.]
MQRFTISLDDALAEEFDRLIALRGYVNRSEAVRDLIRERLGDAMLGSAQAAWCAATVSYVYDHHEQALTTRLMDLQHEHHDLVASSLRTHLDHDNCLETVVLRGPAKAVQDCASHMIALRGVRHGHIHALPLAEGGHGHRHPHGIPSHHKHFTPVN